MEKEIPQVPSNQPTNNTPPTIPSSIPPSSSKKNAIYLALFLIMVLALLAYYFYSSGLFQQNSQEVTVRTTPSAPTQSVNRQLTLPNKMATDEVDLAALEKLPPEILKTKLYFQKSDTTSKSYNVILYEQTPLNSKPKFFLQADSYEFSPDSTKVAYIAEYGPKSDLNFYILDLKTNTTKTYITDSEAKRGVEWSPDGKYILINSGTGSVGSNSVYEVATGKFLGFFGGRSGNIWIDNENIYRDHLNSEISNRGWEGGEASSIVKINIITQESTPVIPGDKLNDYSPRNIEGNCFYFVRRFVNTEEEWQDSNHEDQTETKCLDLTTGEQRTVSDEVVQDKNIDLEKKFMKMFNKKNNFEIGIIENKKISDWKIVSVQDENGNIYENDLYIFNIKDPEGTVVKVARGGGVSWIK